MNNYNHSHSTSETSAPILLPDSYYYYRTAGGSDPLIGMYEAPGTASSDFHGEIMCINKTSHKSLQIIKDSYVYITKSDGFKCVGEYLRKSNTLRRLDITPEQAKAITLFTFKARDPAVRFAETINELLRARSGLLSSLCRYLYTLVTGIQALPELRGVEKLFAVFSRSVASTLTQDGAASHDAFTWSGFTSASRSELSYSVPGMDYSKWAIVEVSGSFCAREVKRFSYSETRDSKGGVSMSLDEFLHKKEDDVILEPGTTFKVLGYDTLKSGDVQAFRGATKIYVKAIKTAPFLEEVTSQYRGRAKVQSRSGYFASEKRDVTDLSTAFEKMEVRWFSLKEALEDADFYGHNASASPTTMSSTEYVNHLTTKSMELVRKSKGIPLVSYRISDGEACAIAIMTFDFGGELRSRNPFVQLNKVLSERNTRDIYNMRKFLVLLLSGLRKLPKVCGRTVYRGISGNKILFNADHYHVGKVLTWPAFSSASFKAEVAEEHCTDENPVLFEISGDYIGYDISALALHGDEVLIEPETTIEVLSISDKKKYMFVRVKAKEKAPVISDVVKEFSKLFSGAVHFKEPPKRSTSFTKSDARKRKTSSPAPTTHHGSSSPTQRSLSPAQPLQCTPSVPWLHSGSVTPPLQLQQPLGQLPQQQQPQLPQFGAWQTPPQGSVFNQGVNLYQQSHQPTQIITTLSPSPTHASPSPAQCYSPPQSFQPQQLQFCQHPQSSSSGTPSQSSPVYQQLPQPQVPNYAPMAWTSYQTQSQYYQQQQQQQQQQQPGSYLVQHLTPIQTLTQPPFQPPQMYNQAASWQQLQSLPQPFPRNRSPGTLSHLQQQPQPQPQFYQYPQSDGFMCQKPSQPPPSAPVGSSSFLSQAVVLKFPCQKEHCSSAQGQAPEKSTLVSIAPAPLQSSPQSTTSAVTAVAPNVSSVELFAQFLVGGDKHFSSIDELCEYIEGGGLKDDVAAKYVSLCYHGIKKMRDAVKEIPGQQPRVFGDFLTVVEKMYGALRTDHCVCLVVDTCGSQVGCKENGVKWMKYVLGELGDALPLKDPAATEFRGFNDKFMFWFLAYTNVSAKEVVPIINSLSHPKFKIKARTCAYTTMATTLKEVPPIDAKAFAEAAKAELCKQYNVDVVLAVPEIKGCSLTVLFLFNNISDAYAVNGKNFTVGNFVCYVSSSVIHKCSANVLPKNEWYKLFFSTEGEYRFIWISSSASTLKCLLSGQSDNNEYAKEMCDIIESNGRQGEKKSPTHK